MELTLLSLTATERVFPMDRDTGILQSNVDDRAMRRLVKTCLPGYLGNREQEKT